MSSVSRRSLPGRVVGELVERDGHAARVADDALLAVGAAELVVQLLLEPGESLVLDPDRPDDLRGDLALRVVAARVVEHADALDLHLLDALALAAPRPCARGTRSRCLRSESTSSSFVSERSRIGARRRAVRTGSFTRNGVAKIVAASSETASSAPWRSVIVPRLAISVTSWTCCVDAMVFRSPPLNASR